MKVDDQSERTAGGSLWKGLGLALLCQFAYLLVVSELSDEARVLGFMMFALVQFGYLFPLAVFYHKRSEERTSNGIIIAGACSLFAAAIWFGYAASRGILPSLSNN
jgi:uncharacterized membrane protein HdeD (DUF308 family)